MLRKNLLLLCVVLGSSVVVGLVTPGCRKSPAKASAEISKVARLEAANQVSEAQFAASVRDYGRAEDLLTKATALCPDTVDYWMALGDVQRTAKGKDAGKKAYERALTIHRDLIHRDSANPEPRLFEIFVLARLGRVDAAREAQDALAKQFPTDPTVQDFVRGKQLDRILADQNAK